MPLPTDILAFSLKLVLVYATPWLTICSHDPPASHLFIHCKLTNDQVHCSNLHRVSAARDSTACGHYEDTSVEEVSDGACVQCCIDKFHHMHALTASHQ